MGQKNSTINRELGTFADSWTGTPPGHKEAIACIRDLGLSEAQANRIQSGTSLVLLLLRTTSLQVNNFRHPFVINAYPSASPQTSWRNGPAAPTTQGHEALYLHRGLHRGEFDDKV